MISYSRTTMKKIISLLIFILFFVPIARALDETADTTRIGAAPIVASAGTAVVANAALTELLKHTIHETRPDGSGHDSWPSRHTSWSFTAASVLAHELYRFSPWWVSAAHAAADAMAMQRVWSGKHYPKDVLGGAAVGLLSGEIGYFVRRIIYPRSIRRLPAASADWVPGIDVATTALFPVSGPARGMSARTGVMSAIRLSLPLAEWWGPAVQIDMRSMPVYAAGTYTDMIDGLGLSAGAAFSWSHDSKWAPHARLMPGIVRNIHTADIPHCGWTFSLEAAGGAYCQLTHRLALGAEAGYLLWAVHRPVSMLTLSLITRACF